MIRAALIALGLLVGLALAAVIEGQAGHLRALPGVTLPPWAETVRDDSTLMAGSAEVRRLPLAAGPADLNWRLAGLGFDGPRYRLRLRGTGLDLAATVRLSLRRAAVEAGEGRIDLAALDLFRSVGVGGQVALDSTAGTLAPGASDWPDLNAGGQIAGLSLDGYPLGDGPVRFASAADGSWRLTADTVSGSGRLSVEAVGSPDDATATVDWTLETETDLPAHLAQRLARFAERSERGWHGRLTFASGL